MSERIPCDHASIESHRVTVERVGRRRPAIPIPDAVDLAVGDRCVVSLGGTETHAVVESDVEDAPRITAVGETRADAGEGPSGRLADWLDSVDVQIGRSVTMDVVTPGYKIGLRPPGESVTYQTRDPPDRSLDSIARDLSE
ncbi:DUF7112 family protein [Halococcoides cellulosivorans]|uniref:Uncharacterized protein n=1 Tax=Halococcoides cellulosivorans TaxID=1679096 RepID=A0A2R4X1M8_9EURY|nr:hypothetical protein [Halococcoides cellulosivorans]AWB27702.1 hypothetical protein HARCEL1_08260 [Halococcoides cellulosivorans]